MRDMLFPHFVRQKVSKIYDCIFLLMIKLAASVPDVSTRCTNTFVVVVKSGANLCMCKTKESHRKTPISFTIKYTTKSTKNNFSLPLAHFIHYFMVFCCCLLLSSIAFPCHSFRSSSTCTHTQRRTKPHA